MQERTSREPNVRPSVCPSVKHVDCDKTKEHSAKIFIPHERTYILVFWQEEWLVGFDSYLKFWVKLTPFERKLQFLIDVCS